MPIRFVQVQLPSERRAVLRLDDDGNAKILKGVATTRDLALTAIRRGQTLEHTAGECELGDSLDLRKAVGEGWVLPPIDHPDAAHVLVTGTGLTHLGSAEGRDKMHRSEANAETLTDSMRMFLLGVKKGKPAPGKIGVQPEWFYKGDGSIIVATDKPLVAPAFALDGGEEPEICGIYLIDDAGIPHRLGFCLANEFSDHVMERQNYLYLSHSKLRPAALGAELLSGRLPSDVRGVSRIRRGGAVIWEKPFLSGEDNMSHSIANLEHHHFKYSIFRRPGDIHVHFFGTATLSCSDAVKCQAGDVFEINASPFLVPLRNAFAIAPTEAVEVRAL